MCIQGAHINDPVLRHPLCLYIVLIMLYLLPICTYIFYLFIIYFKCKTGFIDHLLKLNNMVQY